ncbi:MAG: tetratricopeptide repeat protein, partial [Leptospiraceae bacterium]|nr:tetratricopeptide repeat protein [Leptospiraceae bacterium]
HSLFKYCLNAYIANGVGKSFWIGLYLFDREVSSVKDFGLAKEVLENCLKANKESSTLVSVRFILGVLFWRQNLKKEARAHFETAYKLSEKFPGSIPALSDAEKNAIENDLQILYHKEEGYITPGMLVIPDY